MPGSALDAFRAQQEAADAIHLKLQEVSFQLQKMHASMDALGSNVKLKELLAREESWLREAQRLVTEVRAFRAREARHIWARIARGLVAALFALASAAAAGAGYAWITQPYAAEINELKARMDFAAHIERRLVEMTPAQRRQFDALMRYSPTPRPPDGRHGW
jgi:hypothetical protein